MRSSLVVFRSSEATKFINNCLSTRSRYSYSFSVDKVNGEISSLLASLFETETKPWVWVSPKVANIAMETSITLKVRDRETDRLAEWIASELQSQRFSERVQMGLILIQYNKQKYLDAVRATTLPTESATRLLDGEELRSIAFFVKLLLCFGNSVSLSYWEEVAEVVKEKLSESSQGELPTRAIDLLRLLTGFSHSLPNSPITEALLQTIISNLSTLPVNHFSSFLFQLVQNKALKDYPQDMFSLLAAHAAKTLSSRIGCKMVANSLSALSRIQNMCIVPSKYSPMLRASANDMQVLSLLLEKACAKFMTIGDLFEWKIPYHVTSLVFALESQNVLHDMSAFTNYIRETLCTLKAHDIALALGVLHRAGLLDGSLTRSFSSAIAFTDISQFNLGQLAYVSFVFFACLGERDVSWASRAHDSIATRIKEETQPHVRLAISAAFSDDKRLVSSVPFEGIALRQLFDVFLASHIEESLRCDVKHELLVRLANIQTFNAAEAGLLIRLATGTDDMSLTAAADEAVRRLLAQSVGRWSLVDLSLLRVLQSGERRAYVAGAIDAASEASKAGAGAFIVSAELLLDLFSTDDVGSWVKDNASVLTDLELLTHSVELVHVLAFLKLLRDKEIFMDHNWWRDVIYNAIKELAHEFTPATAIDFFELLLPLGTPCAFPDAVQRILDDVIFEFGTTNEQLPRLLVAAARLQCASFDTAAVKVALQSLSGDEQILLKDAPQKNLLDVCTQVSGNPQRSFSTVYTFPMPPAPAVRVPKEHQRRYNNRVPRSVPREGTKWLTVEDVVEKTAVELQAQTARKTKAKNDIPVMDFANQIDGADYTISGGFETEDAAPSFISSNTSEDTEVVPMMEVKKLRRPAQFAKTKYLSKEVVEREGVLKRRGRPAGRSQKNTHTENEKVSKPQKEKKEKKRKNEQSALLDSKSKNKNSEKINPKVKKSSKKENANDKKHGSVGRPKKVK